MDLGPGGLSSPGPSGYGGGYDATTTGPSGGGGGDNNDPYQGFVQASQPRGISAIQRAVQNTVQRTKNYLSQPANRRGVIGSLIGGALLGPFGAFLGGSLGQRYGGAAQNKITDFFGGGPSPYGDYVPFTNPRFEKQFTMPMKEPNIPFLTEGGITNIDIPNFDPDMNLYAFNPNSLLDKAIKNVYSGYKELGIGEGKLKDLMKKDIEQNKKDGTPLSLPPEAYTLIG